MKKFLYTLLVFCLLNLSVFAESNLQPIDNIVGHYKNKINVVFSDIDGTLLPKETPPKTATPSAKQAAEKLKNAHIPLILTTGRSYTDTKDIADAMGVKNSYFITLQGTEIINPKGKIVYRNVINNNDAMKMINSLEKFLQTNKMDSKIYIYIGGKLYATEKFDIPYTWDEIIVIKSYESFGRFSPNKIGVYETDYKKLESIKDFLQAKYPDYLVYLSTTCFCEVTNPEATKGNCVKKVAKIIHKNLKNAAVFGDAENDSSMLSAARQSGGLAVAVKNAMAALKQNANYETKSVKDGGVDYAIDKILENNKLLEKSAK